MPLPTPVAKQREVVCLPATGHRVILGTAGSGKTTMAILRAAYLSDPELPESGATLLLTFNKPLSSYINTIGGHELARVQVENYHKFARGYLSSRGLIGWNQVADGRRQTALISTAILNVDAAGGQRLDRPISFFEDEIRWLSRHGVQSADDYRQVNRVGRAQARLERDLRPRMWQVYEEYKRLRGLSGFLYDWDDMPTAVASALAEDDNPRRYKHIVIDEGQDLSPEMLRSLALAVPADGSISFFGDVAQQIYGHRMSWRAAGLTVDEVWNFSQNYRNSRAIAALGLAVARMPYYADVPDMVAPEAPTAEGPKPTIVQIAEAANEVPFVVDQATRLAATQSVAVLARTNAQVEVLRRGFKKAPTDLRNENTKWTSGPRVVVGTYHSAKGLEFDAVILPFLSATEFPDPALVADLGLEEAQANDGRLLYVGVTRARNSLILTHSGPATDMLPNEADLLVAVKR